MSANRQDFDLKSDLEARKSAYRFVQWAIRTPSAADKLPKYILEEVELMELYAEKHGWGFLND